jgi:hypothetical protein
MFNPSPMLSKSDCLDFPWNLVDWLILNEGERRELSLAFVREGRAFLGDSGFRGTMVWTRGPQGACASSSEVDDIGLPEWDINVPAGKLLNPVLDTVRSLFALLIGSHLRRLEREILSQATWHHRSLSTKAQSRPIP